MVKKIQSRYTPDSDLFCRSGCFRIGSANNVSTPVKTFELKKGEQKHISHDNFGVNEYIRYFPEDNKYNKKGVLLKKSIKDYFYGDFNNKLNEQLKAVSVNNSGLNCFFFGFEGKRFPKDDELRFLSSRTFAYSDLMTFPIVRNLNEIISADSIEKYLEFLKKVYEEYNTLNNKPILGIIPKSIADGYYKRIIKFYIDNDITSFYFDFEGTYPGNIYPQVLVFFKELKDFGIDQESKESVIYALNPGQGRIAKKNESVEARDIVAVEYGFDVLGKPLHVGGGSSDGPKTIDTTERKLRIFNKNDYGYHRVGIDKISDIYSNDSSIKISDLSVKEVAKSQEYLRIFNMEQKALELKNIQNIIKSKTLKDHIEKKGKITDLDKNQIKKMKKEIKIIQTSLFT